MQYTVECQWLSLVSMWLAEEHGRLQLPSSHPDRENSATNHHPGKILNIMFLQNAVHFLTITELKES